MNLQERSVFSCVRALGPLTVLAILVLLQSHVFGDTGTFIDRHLATDLRVVSYNILNQTIFPDVDAVQADKFERVLAALDPDILNLQEIICHGDCTPKNAEDVRILLNTLAPLPGGVSWEAFKGGFGNVIASKYPLSMQRFDTTPESNRAMAIALVDLPDDRYGTDLYVMNNHFKCCNTMEPPEPLEPNEQLRQRQADALVNWMRDARTIGEFIDLPFGTPMLVVGDLNIINDPDILDPLGTLLSGNIFDESTYGPDSPPDWDGSFSTDAHPLHNGSGSDDYTWRNDNSQFEPGRLDYILYTDSVIQEANKFILNTVDMSPAELTATGLQTYDITVDLTGVRYDHLPVVVDFRTFVVGDFNNNGVVDGVDFLVWQRDPSVGLLSNWEANYGMGATLSASSAAVPEPTTSALALAALCWAMSRRRIAAR